MGNELEEQIEEVAERIIDCTRLVVFTGAGMGTESSIADLYQKDIGDPEVRKRSWHLFSVFRMVDAVEPNLAHYAIAELDNMGKLDCVITQNVDGLHQKAGVPEEKVIELHGSARWVKCLGCHRRYSMEEMAKRLEAGEEEPLCDHCGGILKSATISFGEAMPAAEIAEAARRSRSCDLMLVVGSSLVVYPAAYMPMYAVESGAKLVIINVGDTPMDGDATVCIGEKAGEVMSRIVERVKSKMA
jgi:NAD-dependent deacetylase